MAQFDQTRKTSSLPWFKLFQDDWHDDTRSLTLEQRAVYFDCLCLMYKTGGPIDRPDDWMAHHLHISARLWRSIRDQLIAAGKLVQTAIGLSNKRASEELSSRPKPKPNRARVSAENSVKQSRNNRENPENLNENNKTGQESIEYRGKSTEREKDSTLSRVESGHSARDLREVSRRIFEVAGPGLASEAVAPGLASMVIPEMWLEQGADLERDVLPTIQAKTTQSRVGAIKSWNYFTDAVAQAKATRERGLPQVSADQVRGGTGEPAWKAAQRKGYADALAALAAHPMAE